MMSDNKQGSPCKVVRVHITDHHLGMSFGTSDWWPLCEAHNRPAEVCRRE